MAKNEIAKYKINNHQYSQTYLTIESTEKILELIEEISIENVVKNPIEFAKFLIKSKKLDEFLNIVLSGGPKPIQTKTLRLTLIIEIISDFLSSDEISKITSQIFSLIRHLTEKMENMTKAVR